MELLGPFDLTSEEYREYEFELCDGEYTVYRIDSPVSLFYREGGFTHRVLDAAGVVHIVPGIGIGGAVVRFKPENSEEPVAF